MKQSTSSANAVLLTGATGMVGSLLLADLLRSGFRVATLVRPSRELDAAARVERILAKLESRFGRRFIRPHVITGDIAQRRLRLDSRDQHWIHDNCCTVIHAAANLVFSPASKDPDNEPYRTNYDGTRHLLDVCTDAGIADWHYVSTAYVAGLRTGAVLESECDVGQESANDYERSKILAEQLLKQAGSVGTLTIYRPSIVIDPHPESVMPADLTINGGFSAYEMLSRKFGVPEFHNGFQNLGFRQGDRKNLVTADWVARVMAQIFRRPDLHGRTYHLTSSGGTELSEIEAAFHTVMSCIPGVREQPAVGTDDKAQELIAPFIAAFQPYFRDDPDFDRTNTLAALRISGQPDCLQIGRAQIRELCEQKLAVGGSPSESQMRLHERRPARKSEATEPRVSRHSDSPPLRNLHPAGVRPNPRNGCPESIGLVLSGPRGGEFILRQSDRVVSVARGNAGGERCRLYTSAEHWRQLAAGPNLLAAITSGTVLVETDEAPVSDDELADQLSPFAGCSLETEGPEPASVRRVGAVPSANGRA
ncbi:MAG: SDR family oxidoreductase [Planctomycetaceae bacterium]